MLELTGFAAFALSASATPGPNNVMLTALGASVGIRRGLPALFGIAFGFAVMIFLIAAGVGQLVGQADPRILFAMRVIGFVILARLAWQIASAPVSEDASEQELPAPRLGNFFGAAAFQWVNPKAWIICASAITGYLDATRDVLSQAVFLALTFVLAGLLGCFPWLAVGVLIKTYLRGSRARLFNIIMAVLLLASVIPMLI